MAFVFFLSGIAALIYQIVWAKKLELVFGVSLYATSAVVTTFMAGLALGSLLIGRLADRWKSPLVLFALLQAGIAGFAFLFPGILLLLKRIYVAFYGPFGESHYAMSLVRFALAFLALIVPTSLMGGTLPVIARAYVATPKHLGRDVASLYSANNVGAFLGCLMTGYLFLELLGPMGALWLAAALNLLAVLVSLHVNKVWGTQLAAPETEHEPPVSAARMPDSLGRPVRVALWVFGLEGVASLVYQMAWIRMLIFFVRANIYSVTAIVSTFLAGLSLGAFLCRRWVDRLRNPYRALGAIEMGIGLAALATIPLLPYLLGIHNGLLRLRLGGLPASVAISAANFGVTFLVILVPTAFMGATLPVVSRIYIAEARGLGRKMGLLGCLDTVGSILGAFAGGFVLIPLLGPQRTIVAMALLNMALAGWVFTVDPACQRRLWQRPALLAAATGVLLAALLLTLRPTPVIKHSHILKNRPMLRLIEYQEDQVASVSVVEQKDFGRFLYVNDEPVGGTDRNDRLSHEIEIHQALLLHPQPQRLLIIGMGLGLGVSTALSHGVEVDAVELSPSVVRVHECFKEPFADYRDEHGGRSVLSDPRVRVRVEDGRNYVLGTAQKYDVVHVGGFHPLRSSSAAGFYTLEFFEDVKRVLRPGGHFALWLPTHAMPSGDFQMILRSFLAAFPHATVWHKHSAECCLLVGGSGPLRIDFQRYERSLNEPSVRAHLARSGVREVWDMLDSFCLSEEGLRRAAGEGPLHTDAHPYIEYHTFRGKPGDRSVNLMLLTENRESVWPYLVNVPADRQTEAREQLDKWFRATQELLKAQRLEFQAPAELTAAAYRKAMELNPDDQNVRFLWRRWLAFYQTRMARSSFTAGRYEEGIEHLRLAVEIGPDTEFGAEAKFRLESLQKDARSRPR